MAGEAFCKGTQYTSHPVSHAALPEAGASKNLTLQAKKLGFYSLAGLTVPSRHSQGVLVTVKVIYPGLARLVAYLRLRCGVASPIYERPGPHALAFEFAMRLHKGSELTLVVQLVELGVGGLLSRSYVPPFYVPPWR